MTANNALALVSCPGDNFTVSPALVTLARDCAPALVTSARDCALALAAAGCVVARRNSWLVRLPGGIYGLRPSQMAPTTGYW